jgi:predicted glycosyltransferase
MRSDAQTETLRPTRSKPDDACRIAVFTHDTFGLGHVRRSLHIIRALCARRPDATVLLITGSPALHAFRDLPRQVDVLKLPTLVRPGVSAGAPPHLGIPLSDVTAIRRQVIREAVEQFRPDAFLVDNFPLGSRKELLPTLERLQELEIPAVLGLRDIVDRPDVVRETWGKDGVYDALERLYRRILIYGAPEVLDAPEAYALPEAVRAKVRYCGYVTSGASPHRRPQEIRRELGLESPIVLATVGGGGDGYPLLSSFLDATEGMPDVSTVSITGPLMAGEDRARLAARMGGRGRDRLLEFVADLPSYLGAADVIVAMGGYNTVAELVAAGRPALVMPRNWRYGEHAKGTQAGMEWEQLLRAEAMERLGLVRTIRPEELSPDALSRGIRASLQAPRQSCGPALLGGGAEQAVTNLLDAAGGRIVHGTS